jgi:hypothetical protein
MRPMGAPAVPLVIAGAGLAVALGAESFAEVVARTVVVISPGSSDDLLRQVIIESGAADEGSKRGEVVVVLGLGTAFLAATSAFAQLERGANRIYGTVDCCASWPGMPSGRPLSRFTGGVTRPEPCGMCCGGRWGSARCSPR